MKNLHYHFNPGAKYKTRYQSGFQRFGDTTEVPNWEQLSDSWIGGC
jgi:hypothetical protein